MTCEAFRSRFAPATEDAALLEHLRSCDACLAIAVEKDPDVLFRAVGGGDVIPPGGVDAFVGDVMREVRLRQTQSTVETKPASWTRRLAIAATVALAITTATSVYLNNRIPATAPVNVARATFAVPQAAPRPAVEMYDSESATIVEVPAEASADVKVVMVFDESLPADL
ncbi:MAG TPA: hypothetical protein VF057_06185 [Thermoanaerobaculia bacterium]